MTRPQGVACPKIYGLVEQTNPYVEYEYAAEAVFANGRSRSVGPLEDGAEAAIQAGILCAEAPQHGGGSVHIQKRQVNPWKTIRTIELPSCPDQPTRS